MFHTLQPKSLTPPKAGVDQGNRPERPMPASGSAEQQTGHPLRVFLVEDSVVIRERLTESISSIENVEVVGFADTEATALAALSRIACDALLLDLQLKEGHGFNVLKALRNSSAQSPITIIVLTNFASAQYRGRSMEIGADYFFDKAREYDRVCDVLQELASKRTARFS